ncbi:MAG: hypothetical protein Edafosvirus46_4 [Edafosvirus sp.]|uniref:NTF2 domain-containing protein n=1 Tax=Edafosvirus sp. TaxID=2487765 RepID=A0A3G4ZVI1_9VIRU|nr:MAG: hypothetical protein Edafosvirus46_4 [Edafosvirus sp.]
MFGSNNIFGYKNPPFNQPLLSQPQFLQAPVQIDTSVHHKKITEDFCKMYYTNNSSNLGLYSSEGLYKSDATLTFLEDECTGYNMYLHKLHNLGIKKFNYQAVTWNSQAVGNKSIIINATGNFCAYNEYDAQSQWNKFSETFVISRDEQNKFYICQIMFKLVQ